MLFLVQYNWVSYHMSPLTVWKMEKQEKSLFKKSLESESVDQSLLVFRQTQLGTSKCSHHNQHPPWESTVPDPKGSVRIQTASPSQKQLMLTVRSFWVQQVKQTSQRIFSKGKVWIAPMFPDLPHVLSKVVLIDFPTNGGLKSLVPQSTSEIDRCASNLLRHSGSKHQSFFPVLSSNTF